MRDSDNQLDDGAARWHSSVMDKIDTPTVRLELVDGQLMATHKPSGVQVPISAQQLERWLLRKLRELF